MSRVSSVLAVLLALAGSALADDGAIQEGPESFGYASFKDGKVHVRFSQLQIVEAPRTVVRDGKKVMVTGLRPQWGIVTSAHDPKKIKLYDDTGKEVAATEFARLLEKEQLVIITSAAKLNQFFAAFIKPGTYNLVVTEE